MTRAADAAARAGELKRQHENSYTTRHRVRAILNGGEGAVRALLGPKVSDPTLPWPNLMVSGLTRMAQKIGGIPSVTAPAPVGAHAHSERARERSEKKERIVEAYDSYDRLELQLPQVGRWLPGYGYAVWTLSQGLTPDGNPYPKASLRDPHDCFPGSWGTDQQPQELAIFRRVTAERLIDLYPEHKRAIEGMKGGGYSWERGGVVLGGSGWEGTSTHGGVSIVEYYDRNGVTVTTSDGSLELDHLPNPLDRATPFVVAKRFSFDDLTGQYDHIIGLMAAMARINVLAFIAMQDAVFAPVNIFGEAPKPRYRQGRTAVNVMPPGTQVSRDVASIPYQYFEEGNRIERQLRIVAGYPITDDSQSPLSFATGRGLEELNSSVTAEVAEYHKVLRIALEDLDSKRLEWDQALYGVRSKPLVGERKGKRYAESYTPSTDIAGDFKTNRKYGVFAGFDKTESVIMALQLIDARLMDRLTAQESIQGLNDLDLNIINERIRNDDTEMLLYQILAAAAQQGDPRAVMAFIEQLPDSERKETLKKFFTPQEPQMSPEEMAMAGMGGGQQPPGPPPPVTTALRRLALSGPAAGVQTVTRQEG